MGVRRIVITVTLLAMALPAAAGAQDVPSGNSGIDQYRESVPAVGGNKPTGPNSSGGGKSSGGGNTSGTGSASGSGAASGGAPNTAQGVEKLGPDGQAAEAAAATAPNSPPGQGGFASPSSTSGDSGDSGPGMGVVLPIILALALAGALTFAVLRRRRGTPPGAA